MLSSLELALANCFGKGIDYSIDDMIICGWDLIFIRIINIRYVICYSSSTSCQTIVIIIENLFQNVMGNENKNRPIFIKFIFKSY